MSTLAHASKLKEHDDDDDFQGTISKGRLDELLSGVENADDLLGDRGLMTELKVRLMEQVLGAELRACRPATVVRTWRRATGFRSRPI